MTENEEKYSTALESKYPGEEEEMKKGEVKSVRHAARGRGDHLRLCGPLSLWWVLVRTRSAGTQRSNVTSGLPILSTNPKGKGEQLSELVIECLGMKPWPANS